MHTIQEVADLFNVHYQTVRNWIKDGVIKATKISGTVRISDEEIERIKVGVTFASERQTTDNLDRR